MQVSSKQCCHIAQRDSSQSLLNVPRSNNAQRRFNNEKKNLNIMYLYFNEYAHGCSPFHNWSQFRYSLDVVCHSIFMKVRQQSTDMSLRDHFFKGGALFQEEQLEANLQSSRSTVQSKPKTVLGFLLGGDKSSVQGKASFALRLNAPGLSTDLIIMP